MVSQFPNLVVRPPAMLKRMVRSHVRPGLALDLSNAQQAKPMLPAIQRSTAFRTMAARAGRRLRWPIRHARSSSAILTLWFTGSLAAVTLLRALPHERCHTTEAIDAFSQGGRNETVLAC